MNETLAYHPKRSGRIILASEITPLPVYLFEVFIFSLLISVTIPFLMIVFLLGQLVGIILCVIAGIGLIRLVLSKLLIQTHTSLRALATGAMIGFGLQSFYLVLYLGILLFNTPPPFHILTVLTTSISLCLGIAMLLLGYHYVLRQFGREIILQTGTLCPNCGFDLIGNLEQDLKTCPECGEYFDFADLGTTKRQFAAAQHQAGITPPAASPSPPPTSPAPTALEIADDASATPQSKAATPP